MAGKGLCSELTKQKLSSKYLAPDNRNLIFGVAISLTFFAFISTEALSTTDYWFSQFHLTIRAEKVFHQIQLKRSKRPILSQQSHLQIFHLFSGYPVGRESFPSPRILHFPKCHGVSSEFLFAPQTLPQSGIVFFQKYPQISDFFLEGGGASPPRPQLGVVFFKIPSKLAIFLGGFAPRPAN